MANQEGYVFQYTESSGINRFLLAIAIFEFIMLIIFFVILNYVNYSWAQIATEINNRWFELCSKNIGAVNL
jgi:hypothetical protein